MSYKKTASALLLCAAFAGVAFASPAYANGVVRVQQSDGSVRDYPQVRMAWTGQTLWLHSADGKGVLQITTGACSYAGSVLRCLPYSITLHQSGKKHPIAIANGTVYINLSGKTGHVPYSSRPIGPHGLMVAIKTQHGTFITVRGHLDEVK
ncbi:MAG TPA: hypothetical protein VMF11_02265 [Candidatus Baltobacteraceae bacterium]|nr:hypothetical protein [Candidatus Baltobacteraceae bacterium]